MTSETRDGAECAMRALFLLLDWSAPVDERLLDSADSIDDSEEDEEEEDNTEESSPVADVAGGGADEEFMPEDEAMPDTVTAGTPGPAGSTAGGVSMMPAMSALSLMLVVLTTTNALVGLTVTLSVTL